MTESYTKTRSGVRNRMKEFAALYRFHTTEISGRVAGLLHSMERHQASIESRLGEPLRNKAILEIGPGQMLKQARYFGAHNQVTAVDLNEVAVGWEPRVWWRMYKGNGFMRVLKTAVRKVIGVDRKFAREFTRQMPAAANASIKLLQRDAANTGLPAGSFDCVLSFSVLEHIPQPRPLMREIVRLLRAGGVSYHVVHTYTSDSGAHDPRTFVARHPGFPYWCHLRDDKAHLCAPNSYVNRISLAEWRKMAAEEFPGIEIETIVQFDSPVLAAELRKLRERDELGEFSDEELMTACLILIWTKPPGSGMGSAEGPSVVVNGPRRGESVG